MSFIKPGNINPSSSRGFSLIELMIVVAIVGILAAIAYPSYIDQVHKAKRATAATSILECASVLERRFTATNTYDGGCPNVVNDDYTLSVATPTVPASCTSNGGNTNCFVVTATAGPSLLADSDCGTMTFNHLGLKGSTRRDASAGDNQICWRTT